MPSKKTKKYQGFGLTFSSEIELPGLPAFEGFAEIVITLGETPESLENPTAKGVLYQIRCEEFLLQIPDVARFWVKSKNLVVVEPFENSSLKEVALFLLGSVTGFLLHQRPLLPMHGSCVTRDGKTFLFSGLSGAGKSTLAGWFVKQGWQLLADDISAISFENGQPMVNFGLGGLKLWKDALKVLDLPESKNRVRESLEKFFVPQSLSLIHEKCALDAIFILNSHNNETIECEQIKGLDKFNMIRRHAFRPQFVKGNEPERIHFYKISQLAGKVKLFKLTRPSKKFLFFEIEKIIHEQFDKQ